MTSGAQVNYAQLLKRHGRIRIPLIQRDYAQGRREAKDVRDEFLKALEGALLKPVGDPSLPLNLDFVYGSVEGEGAGETQFLPLDGQQRLTTLFLLHWYLAWLDQRWEDFEHLFCENRRARFAYSVRPSSTEFFHALVMYRPLKSPGEIGSLVQNIEDQPWYFRSWRLDPTIQSVLGMLDALHARFVTSEGLFGRLIDEQRPAITFQLLDLNDFGLSDDLYIKMNARGRPLTAFETFKARYEQDLRDQFVGMTFSMGEQQFPVAEYVALKLDTTWGDLFWRLRDKKSNQYDEALMNTFRAVALATRSPEHPKFLDDAEELRQRSPSYTAFHTRSWLDEPFTWALIRLFETWSAANGSLATVLPSTRYFDEKKVFDAITEGSRSLSYTDIVQFAAYVKFVVKHREHVDTAAFEDWMRIVYNLSTNTGYNRADDLRRSMVGVDELLEYAGNILVYFAGGDDTASGFNDQQIREEQLKAQLILAQETWRTLIERAEGHGYLRGQIEFLLDFSGAKQEAATSDPADWTPEIHEERQKLFSWYLQWAELTFSARGLADLPGYRWQRGLLTIGDYLLPSGRNKSLLVDSTTEEGSWKRLLRGGKVKELEAREILKKLWNLLSLEEPISDQLDRLIANTMISDAWRAALVNCPAALSFCEKRCIRQSDSGLLYLLRRTQLNGAHAELFTYCLWQKLDGQKKFFKLLDCSYEPVNDTYSEPHMRLNSRAGVGQLIAFAITFKNDSFLIRADMGVGEELASVGGALRGLGFSEVDNSLELLIPRPEVVGVFRKLDEELKGCLDLDD